MSMLTPFMSKSLFDRYFEDLDNAPVVHTPELQVQRNDKEYLVRAKLPGVNKEDVKIEVEDGYLTISGKYTQTKEEEYENVHSEFRSYSEFKRALSLDHNRIEVNQVTAELKNGILEVALPLKEAVKPKQISIKTG